MLKVSNSIFIHTVKSNSETILIGVQEVHSHLAALHIILPSDDLSPTTIFRFVPVKDQFSQSPIGY